MQNEINKVVRYFNEKKWVLEEDYDIYTSGYSYKDIDVNNLCVSFKVAENKDVIEYLKSEGWIEEKRYKNDDGDPSLWGTKEMGNNIEHRVLMVIMVKDIGNDYEKVTEMVCKLKGE